jgi:hypothetical protein
MPEHLSNVLYLHPSLHFKIDGILKEIKNKLPAGWKTQVSSEGVHRTPAEQFEIFKKGRQFRNGKWVKVGTTFTGLDGFAKKSRHNFLPAQAVDIILIQPNGKILEAGPQEKKIESGAAKFGFDWGGNWKGFQDMPHIEIPKSKLFKSSFDRDEALQWQKYLFVAGELHHPEDLDGFFGSQSLNALEKVTGIRERTPSAWKKLFNRFGPIEGLTHFQNFEWIPAI